MSDRGKKALEVLLNDKYLFMVIISHSRSISELRVEVQSVARELFTEFREGQVTILESNQGARLSDRYEVGELLENDSRILAYSSDYKRSNKRKRKLIESEDGHHTCTCEAKRKKQEPPEERLHNTHYAGTNLIDSDSVGGHCHDNKKKANTTSCNGDTRQTQLTARRHENDCNIVEENLRDKVIDESVGSNGDDDGDDEDDIDKGVISDGNHSEHCESDIKNERPNTGLSENTTDSDEHSQSFDGLSDAKNIGMGVDQIKRKLSFTEGSKRQKETGSKVKANDKEQRHCNPRSSQAKPTAKQIGKSTELNQEIPISSQAKEKAKQIENSTERNPEIPRPYSTEVSQDKSGPSRPKGKAALMQTNNKQQENSTELSQDKLSEQENAFRKHFVDDMQELQTDSRHDDKMERQGNTASGAILSASKFKRLFSKPEHCRTSRKKAIVKSATKVADWLSTQDVSPNVNDDTAACNTERENEAPSKRVMGTGTTSTRRVEHFASQAASRRHDEHNYLDKDVNNEDDNDDDDYDGDDDNSEGVDSASGDSNKVKSPVHAIRKDVSDVNGANVRTPSRIFKEGAVACPKDNVISASNETEVNEMIGLPSTPQSSRENNGLLIHSPNKRLSSASSVSAYMTHTCLVKIQKLPVCSQNGKPKVMLNCAPLQMTPLREDDASRTDNDVILMESSQHEKDRNVEQSKSKSSIWEKAELSVNINRLKLKQIRLGDKEQTDAVNGKPKVMLNCAPLKMTPLRDDDACRTDNDGGERNMEKERDETNEGTNNSVSIRRTTSIQEQQDDMNCPGGKLTVEKPHAMRSASTPKKRHRSKADGSTKVDSPCYEKDIEIERSSIDDEHEKDQNVEQSKSKSAVCEKAELSVNINRLNLKQVCLEDKEQTDTARKSPKRLKSQSTSQDNTELLQDINYVPAVQEQQSESDETASESLRENEKSKTDHLHDKKSSRSTIESVDRLASRKGKSPSKGRHSRKDKLLSKIQEADESSENRNEVFLDRGRDNTEVEETPEMLMESSEHEKDRNVEQSKSKSAVCEKAELSVNINRLKSKQIRLEDKEQTDAVRKSPKRLKSRSTSQDNTEMLQDFFEYLEQFKFTETASKSPQKSGKSKKDHLYHNSSKSTMKSVDQLDSGKGKHSNNTVMSQNMNSVVTVQDQQTESAEAASGSPRKNGKSKKDHLYHNSSKSTMESVDQLNSGKGKHSNNTVMSQNMNSVVAVQDQQTESAEMASESPRKNGKSKKDHLHHNSSKSTMETVDQFNSGKRKHSNNTELLQDVNSVATVQERQTKSAEEASESPRENGKSKKDHLYHNSSKSTMESVDQLDSGKGKHSNDTVMSQNMNSVVAVQEQQTKSAETASESPRKNGKSKKDHLHHNSNSSKSTMETVNQLNSGERKHSNDTELLKDVNSVATVQERQTKSAETASESPRKYGKSKKDHLHDNSNSSKSTMETVNQLNSGERKHSNDTELLKDVNSVAAVQEQQTKSAETASESPRKNGKSKKDHLHHNSNSSKSTMETVNQLNSAKRKHSNNTELLQDVNSVATVQERQTKSAETASESPRKNRKSKKDHLHHNSNSSKSTMESANQLNSGERKHSNDTELLQDVNSVATVQERQTKSAEEASESPRKNGKSKKDHLHHNSSKSIMETVDQLDNGKRKHSNDTELLKDVNSVATVQERQTKSAETASESPRKNGKSKKDHLHDRNSSRSTMETVDQLDNGKGKPKRLNTSPVKDKALAKNKVILMERSNVELLTEREGVLNPVNESCAHKKESELASKKDDSLRNNNSLASPSKRVASKDRTKERSQTKCDDEVESEQESDAASYETDKEREEKDNKTRSSPLNLTPFKEGKQIVWMKERTTKEDTGQVALDFAHAMKRLDMSSCESAIRSDKRKKLGVENIVSGARSNTLVRTIASNDQIRPSYMDSRMESGRDSNKDKEISQDISRRVEADECLDDTTMDRGVKLEVEGKTVAQGSVKKKSSKIKAADEETCQSEQNLHVESQASIAERVKKHKKKKRSDSSNEANQKDGDRKSNEKEIVSKHAREVDNMSGLREEGTNLNQVESEKKRKTKTKEKRKSLSHASLNDSGYKTVVEEKEKTEESDVSRKTKAAKKDKKEKSPDRVVAKFSKQSSEHSQQKATKKKSKPLSSLMDLALDESTEHRSNTTVTHKIPTGPSKQVHNLIRQFRQTPNGFCHTLKNRKLSASTSPLHGRRKLRTNPRANLKLNCTSAQERDLGTNEVSLEQLIDDVSFWDT